MRQKLQTLRQLAARNQTRAVGAALALTAGAASAQGASGGAAAFADALASASADVAIFGAGLVALSVVGIGFKIAVKYVKNLKGAA